MKRYAAIAVLVYAAFAIEFMLFNAFGSWGTPQFTVLVVVFCALYWGIRHSLWAAVAAGVLHDAFGIDPFGTCLLVYLAAAFLSTVIRRTLYQPGSQFSRAVVAFLVLVGVFALQLFLKSRFTQLPAAETMLHVFLPQTAMTMLAATMTFSGLRDIAVKFKI